MNKKNTSLLGISCIIVFGVIITSSFYGLYIDSIMETLQTIEGAWYAFLIILIRMGVLLLMSSYMFKKWFEQESHFYSDLPFLFGILFLLLIFGKAFDLLYNFTYYTADTITFLLIYKIRFIIMILNISPMYYFSIGMILFFFSLFERCKKLENKIYSQRLQFIVLLSIVISEIIIIVLFLNEITGPILLPSIAIPSFLIVVLVFYLAYRNNRLSQANPLILTIGFAAYLISLIIRPIFHVLIGKNPLTIILSELIDVNIYLVIFLGLIDK